MLDQDLPLAVVMGVLETRNCKRDALTKGWKIVSAKLRNVKVASAQKALMGYRPTCNQTCLSYPRVE